jgi:hypothetical protein
MRTIFSARRAAVQIQRKRADQIDIGDTLVTRGPGHRVWTSVVSDILPREDRVIIYFNDDTASQSCALDEVLLVARPGLDLDNDPSDVSWPSSGPDLS